MDLKPITVSDFEKYKPFFTNQRYRLCSYSLANIIAWSSKTFQACVGELGEALVFALETTAIHHDKRHILLPVSPKKEYSPEQVCEIARNCGHYQVWSVPGGYIERFGREYIEKWFYIESHEEFSDYIYLKSDLFELKGNRYSKKRNLINQFKKTWKGKYKAKEIEAGDVSDCKDFLEKWCEERNCDEDPELNLACEKLAANKALDNIRELKMGSLCLLLDGEICAFALSSSLTAKMGALHFEKAYSRIKCLYQYFDQQCAKRMFTGFTYINKENDMGIPGLAKSKQSYYPVKIVDSYKLTIK